MNAMTSGAIDLRALDRDVARAHKAHTTWLSRLARDPDANADVDPIEPWRHVAGKTAYDQLATLDVVSFNRPLRDALRRWVYALVQARVGREIDVELAKAMHEPKARYRIGVGREVSWRDAWRGVVTAETEVERRGWLDAAVERGPYVAAIARRRADRRAEVAHRLGLDTTDALASPSSRADLAGAASALLG
jgi:hypothetical protein